MNLWDYIKLWWPMGVQKRHALQIAAEHLDVADTIALKRYLKLDRTFAITKQLQTSEKLLGNREWPYFKSHLQDELLNAFLTRINDSIAQQIKERAYADFAPDAFTRISAIVGYEQVGRAFTVQLFAKEPVHVLLIGDDNTGKSELLHFGQTFATMAVETGQRSMICVDELQDLKARDLAMLQHALSAQGKNICILATTSPTTGSFIGKSAESIKRQIPVEASLLALFHLPFVLRNTNDKKPLLSKEEMQFLHDYIAQAKSLDVQLDERVSQELMIFVKQLKAEERNFIVRIGQHTTTGLCRIAVAMARAELSSSVEKRHADAACNLLHAALSVPREET